MTLHDKNYKDLDNDTLIEMSVELMDYIEKRKSKEFLDKFYTLMEIEKELTLREE